MDAWLQQTLMMSVGISIKHLRQRTTCFQLENGNDESYFRLSMRGKY